MAAGIDERADRVHGHAEDVIPILIKVGAERGPRACGIGIGQGWIAPEDAVIDHPPLIFHAPSNDGALKPIILGIRHPGCDPDPRSCRQIDHFRRLSRTERKSPGSAPFSTRIIALPGNSMWIEPYLAGCCSEAGSSISAALEAAIVTGSKACAETAESASSPRSNDRRHLNSWFAFKPCARATSATLAPGSIVNCTICRFSDTDRHLRTRGLDPSD